MEPPFLTRVMQDTTPTGHRTTSRVNRMLNGPVYDTSVHPKVRLLADVEHIFNDILYVL